MNHDTEQLWWRAFVFRASHRLCQDVAGLALSPFVTQLPLTAVAQRRFLSERIHIPTWEKQWQTLSGTIKGILQHNTEGITSRRGYLPIPPESLGRRYCSKKQRKGFNIAIVFQQLFQWRCETSKSRPKLRQTAVSFAIMAAMFVKIPQPPVFQATRKKHTCLCTLFVGQCSRRWDEVAFK